MLEKFWHKYLRVPYTLHVHERRRARKATTTIVFLHGVGSSGAAWRDVTDGLKGEVVNILVVDLLGFGKSPRPMWATYDAGTQVRALAKTLLTRGVYGKIVLVGHSMGALIAIEFARRYPFAARSLVLCSPPLYDDKNRTLRLLPDRDHQLKKLYEIVSNYPEKLISASKIAKKYGLIGRAFDIRPETVDEYIAALKTAIISQTSLRDIEQITVPIHITYGTLDPFVIGHHIRKLRKTRPNIEMTSFVGGHEIEGRYVPLVVRTVKGMLH